MAGDALKALSKLHQSQYMQPSAPLEEPYDDYMAEAQEASDDPMMGDMPLDAMQMPDTSPALDALRRLQAVNLAAHGQE